VKKILIILIVISFFSATEIKATGSAVIPWAEFSSLEDFLKAYLTTQENGDIPNYIEGGWDLQYIDLTELDTIHLPVSLPKDFIIRDVTVNEEYISLIYFPKDVEVTADTFWEALTGNPSVSLIIWLNLENRINDVLQRRGQTVDDLIDGKYLAQHDTRNSYITFNWQHGKMYIGLEIYLHQQHTEEFKALFGDGDVLDLVRFAETRTVDLTDEEEVRNLIKFGERFQRGDISGSGKVTTSDALEILRFTAGLQNVIAGDERAEAAADVNGDGRIDTADAVMVLRRVAGL